jgi:hypothetical protein
MRNVRSNASFSNLTSAKNINDAEKRKKGEQKNVLYLAVA